LATTGSIGFSATAREARSVSRSAVSLAWSIAEAASIHHSVDQMRLRAGRRQTISSFGPNFTRLHTDSGLRYRRPGDAKKHIEKQGSQLLSANWQSLWSPFTDFDLSILQCG
jgi:hypothetical protein